MAVGELAAGDGEVFGPAPRVEINVGGANYPTSALRSTFQPYWDESLLLDLRHVDANDLAVIAIRDGIDGSVIASTQMPIGALVSKSGRTISELKSVPVLNLRIRPATPAMNEAQDVWVPAKQPAVIDVVGGDVILITASGFACVKDGLCVAPDGSDPGNNTGGWDVRVVANPDLEAPAKAPATEYEPSPEATTTSASRDDILGELTVLKDKMCACTDQACAEQVTEDMMRLGERHQDTRATEAEMHAARAITEDLVNCMSRATGEDAGTP